MTRFLCFLFFALPQVVTLPISGQSCTGNLGENIFAEGDFGSGAANVISTDPGIAPGYSYTTNVPPEDGFYTITNNTGAWPDIFPSWLRIRDRSTDPNGYMMVVNASFDPGLFYAQEITGLCDNTQYLFSADVINLVREFVGGHIAPNISFLIDGVEQFATGNIPQSELWDNYGFAFTTEPGQTSVTLSLRNNAPGGIGNDLALDNISFRACGPRAIVVPEAAPRVCPSDEAFTLIAEIVGNQFDTPAIQWQQSFDEGQTWQDIPNATDEELEVVLPASGFYFYRYLLANSPANLSTPLCRIVSDPLAIEAVQEEFFVTDTICQGFDYEVGSSVYTEAGSYVDTLVSSLGCDSIVNLDLTLVPLSQFVFDLDIAQPLCEDDLGSLTINSITGGNPPYINLLINTFGDSLGFFNAADDLQTGFYIVAVIDRFGCPGFEPFNIEPAAPFSIDLGPDRSVRLGESVDIVPSSNTSISSTNWLPPIPGCADPCLTVSFSPFNSAFYALTAQSELGCRATDSIFIEVRPRRQVYIPNAFSPNEDGVNDAFAPLVVQPNVSSILRFDVFNRWGGQVYSQVDWLPTGISDGWDGKIGDQLAQTGIYVYRAEIQFLDGEVIIYEGDVMLVR
ncbi:MAG: gliding motility-associated C-terminal domain-containing protein [Bacteroidota bacterium]